MTEMTGGKIKPWWKPRFGTLKDLIFGLEKQEREATEKFGTKYAI